ncbi:MAG: phosphoenolpyruvate mutase [Candidatus Spechtbacterales bacterium]|nr:phosphoenolpyruvate mutase [Candidatus Spechtbacterales bacterium]
MNKDKKKIVYIGMCADILHPGHLNIIKEGQKLGEVVVGLLTDEAVASYKRLPLMSYDQRFEVVNNIKGVSNVIPQTTLDYRPNLLKLKPDYVVHGADWQSGTQEKTRQQVLDAISEWGGSLVEPKYTEGISSTKMHEKIKSVGISPDMRLSQLNRLLHAKKTVRAIEAHNGLSAIVAENTQIKNESGEIEQFDALWISSFTDSTAKGKPDIELIDKTSRLATINEILDVTTKPILVDGDTGGHPKHFAHTVKALERLGISAVVIEDKNGLKRNSLHKDKNEHSQEDIDVFVSKIRAGLEARINDEFMVIARIESFILGKDQKDALSRAKAYIDAGASAIMIHSKDKNGSDVKKFCEFYNKFENRRPLMLVPTSYNKTTEEELSEWGANIIVHANHLLRASYPAMQKAAKVILESNRSFEVEEICTPVEEFFKIIPDA